MVPGKTPMLDRRQAEDLLYELLRRIPQHYPEWKSAELFPADHAGVLALADDRTDIGMALLRMAARMHDVINAQLNRVPQKNFLTFLDFMGIDPAPPRPARVPLTFLLAEGAKSPGQVPKGAKVGVADAEDIVFEVDADVTVGAVRPQRLVSLHPRTDQWTDHPLGTDGRIAGDALLFHGDPREQRMEHTLWIGDRRLFGLGESYQLGVRMKFNAPATPFAGFLNTLRWEASPDWAMRPAAVEIADNELSIRFGRMAPVPEAEVAAVSAAGRVQHHVSRWLRARTTQPVPPGLPEVSSVLVTAEQEVANAAPEIAFANASPVDLSMDLFPFGERPRFNDTFYVGSAALLSTPGARVSLHIGLTAALPPPDTQAVTLTWEYWSSATKAWAALGRSQVPVPEPTDKGAYDFEDETDALTKGGTVSFVCPPIGKTGVHGKENHWLRVRITGGNYGIDAQLSLRTGAPEQPEERTLADYEYREASYRPPSIATLTMSTSYKESVAPEICLASTASIYRDVTALRPFRLAEPAADTAPALYIGLAGLEVLPVSSPKFYFLIHPRRFDEHRPAVQTDSPTGPTLVLWQYWNGSAWVRLSVDDETANLTQPGLIGIDLRPDMAARHLFGERLMWIRATLVRGGHASPRIGGVFPNTVWATQALTFENETLGSSNGEPHQTFSFSKAPVLDGETIEVREPVAPPAGDAVRNVFDPAGNVTEIWVRWQRVTRLAASGPADRHYELDRERGRLLFGDGVNGLIPPTGKANIVAYRYRSGGGRAGNRARGTITVLKKTHPSVDSVTNHAPATQGLDQEDLDRVMARGPHTIKNRGRAVTAEDFEWIGRQAAGEVARTRCLAATRVGPSGSLIPSTGWVTLIVVPEEASDRPMPDEILLARVRTDVTRQCLVNLVDSIDVVGPAYVEVAVDVVVVPRPDIEDKLAQQRVDRRLHEYLHPLRGGSAGTGWEFGRSVALSELMRVVRETDGIDRVLSIGLRSSANGPVPNPVPLPAHGLPCSGMHTVTIARG